jgi:hypothetical protein
MATRGTTTRSGVRCVVGRWKTELDDEDKQAFNLAVTQRSRADLYGFICAASASKPFGLTALKDCLNRRCVCD